MFFCRKVWHLLIRYYIKKNLKRSDLLGLWRYPTTCLPKLFWTKNRRRRRFWEYYLHNGKCLQPVDPFENKIPLSYYAPTITYGAKKIKKKVLKKKSSATTKKTSVKKTNPKKK